MNVKGYTVGTYTNKKVKKKNSLPMCPTCRKCRDRNICNNRKSTSYMNKCQKCKNCTDNNNCDKFYITVQHRAMLTIGKDIKTGKAIRKHFTGETEEKALEELFKYKMNIKKSGQSIDLEKTDKTIVVIAQEIEDSKYRMGKTKANAYNTNMATLERIKKNKFANIPIDKVSKKQIEDFLEKERIKSNSTIKKDYRMLKCIYEHANHRMYIANNFFEGLDKIEKPISLKEDKDVKALTSQEQKALESYLKANPSKYNNIILLCLYSGIRIGEALALNYKEDIDLDNKMLIINKTLTKDKNKQIIIGPTKTKNGKRRIQINELIENVLKDALNTNVIKNKYNVLFCQENGQLYADNTINSALKRICKNANISTLVNTHMLRHSFATRCIEAGISLPVLQKLMGHADISTTVNTYGDIYLYYQQQETQKFVDLIKNNKE